jgi:hypothetical protein
MTPVKLTPTTVELQFKIANQGYRPIAIAYDYWVVYVTRFPRYIELFHLNTYLKVSERAYFLWRFDRITGHFTFDTPLNLFLMPA